MPISGETFGFPDLTFEDNDKVYESVSVHTYEDKTTDEKSDALLNISYYSEGEWEIKINLT